jgi:tetratricopeptide (TPR) repeat protein
MIDRSLVVVDGDDSYRLLDSLRAFAADCSDRDPSERDATYARLARWLAASYESADVELRGPDQQATFGRLRAEVPNVRAALGWSFSGGDPQVGVRLTCSLAWFWVLEGANFEGANDEAVRWLQQALRVPGLGEDVRAHLLEGIGINRLVLGAVTDGQHALRESVDLWSQAGVEPGLLALIYLGVAHRWLGQFDDAAVVQDRAVAIARHRHDDWGLAWSLLFRARVAVEQCDDLLAGRLLGEARSLAERGGDRRMVGWILLESGLHTLRQGDPQRALELTTEAAEIHEAFRWDPGAIASLGGLGRVLVRLGRTDDAMAHHRRAVRIALQLGHSYSIAEALEAQADAVAARGLDDVAVQLLGAAAALRSKLADRELTAAERSRDVAALDAELRARLGDDGFAAAFRRGQHRAPGELA